MKRRQFIKSSAAVGLGFSLSPISCTQSLDCEFLILGAGMAGLNLAYQLQKAGKDFILLEGSARLGGRLFTHPELKRDVGGRGIGDKYVEVMKLVEDLGVELIDITDSLGGGTAIYLDGKLYSQWEDSSTNPSRLEFSRLQGSKGLESLDAWFQHPELDESYATFLEKQGHTKEAIDLINISANYNDVYQASSINSLHSRAFRQFNGTRRLFNFKGGTQAFVKKIADAVEGPIITNKMVNKVVDKGTRVEVSCDDGSLYRAKKVISTLPFSTLRAVELDVSLNPKQSTAINELPYTLITQIHLQADEPFWEEDTMPISMWTDTPLERLMKLNPKTEAGELVCWVNGKGTVFFDEMSDAEIEAFTLEKLAEIRPSTEGRISYVGTHKWGLHPYAKGAYCEFGVGHAALFEDMIKPAGNLHFAGEHAARKSRGIEGAAESAIRVLNELEV